MDFLESMPGFFWFEAISFIVALACLPWMHKRFLKWFAPFLMIIVVVEISGWYLPRVLHKHNAWIFNFSVPTEYLFYSFIYYEALETLKFKSFCKIIGIAYGVFCVLILITHGVFIFQNQMLVVGNLLGICFACIYFFEILKKEQVIDLVREPMFWITCGVFLFNLGEVTYTLFRPILTANRWDVALTIFKAVNNKLIFWLYGCITIGLLCSPLYKYKKIYAS
jgi:hypothetical protein